MESVISLEQWFFSTGKRERNMLEWACHLFNNYSVNIISAYHVPVTFLCIGVQY